jgi:GH18 family chitinase
MQPESIPAGALTHINLAFMEFDETFNLVDVQGDIVARVSRLKMTYPGLRVNVAIGGWDFNDPPTSNYFSNMASSYDNRQTFIQSVISYLQKYGLDGIDIGANNPGDLPKHRYELTIYHYQTGSIQQLLTAEVFPPIRRIMLYFWVRFRRRLRRRIQAGR